VTSLGERLRLGGVWADLSRLQRLHELALGVRGESVEGLPRQRELRQLLGRQLPVGEVDGDQAARLVVAERHPLFHPPLEACGVQAAGLVQQFPDPETHPVDGGVHLVLDLGEP
jgi:hypothetical protein